MSKTHNELIQNTLRVNDFSKLEVVSMSIFHSTTIVLKLIDNHTDTILLMECNYCEAFKGKLGCWENISLDLDLISQKEIATIGKRKLEQSYFVLNDLNNGFYVKFKYIRLLDEVPKNEMPSIQTQEGTNRSELIHKIQHWKQARVRVINSHMGGIKIVLDHNTHERHIAFAKANPNKLYTLDTKESLMLYCHAPTFLHTRFNPWEIDHGLILKDDTLQDQSGNFLIQFGSISISTSTD